MLECRGGPEGYVQPHLNVNIPIVRNYIDRRGSRMLVYANHFQFQGKGAEGAILKAIGGWLKEQLGFGLHPDKLRRDGVFTGRRKFTRGDGSHGEVNSWLRVVATDEDEPVLCSWTLKNPDDSVKGRQWITELGYKKVGQNIHISCVVKTEEVSTLAATHPATASRPRVIAYIINNIQKAADAVFAPTACAMEVKTVGEDLDSYHALAAEIVRPDRDCPLLLVSPTKEGEYLLNVADLQEKLVGLGQVVKVCPGFNSYEMAEIVGQQRSAWSGAVNVLFSPLPTGTVRNRLFRSEEILNWGNTQQERVAQLLAWVTNITNISRLRQHIRPEGVVQLALRRRMAAVRAESENMDIAQLRAALDQAATKAEEQEKYFEELVEENAQLEERLSKVGEDLKDAREESAKKDFTIQSLKENLARAGTGGLAESDASALIDWACRNDPPSPLECLDLIERAYGDHCIVLPTARSSAEQMTDFDNGRELMRLLRKLVTEYRRQLMDGGDSKARAVFGKSEYAAKESETVMRNKAMRRQRTFVYEGEEVEMFRHLKIGVADDLTRTIRVYFHWDAERKKIVIGHCGKHLAVSQH